MIRRWLNGGNIEVSRLSLCLLLARIVAPESSYFKVFVDFNFCVNHSMAGPCMAGPCMAGPCMAGSCMASPCMAGPCMAGPCMAGPCMAGPCMAGQCMAGPCMAAAHSRFWVGYCVCVVK